MPRLSNRLYLARHHDLKWIRTKIPKLLEVLTPHELWSLHEFYQFTEDLTDAELLEHRRVITKKHPSLPNQTGKSYLHIYRCHVAAVHRAKGNSKIYYQVLDHSSRHPRIVMETGTRAGAIQVTARFRPEPDYKRLAKALLMFLEEEGAD